VRQLELFAEDGRQLVEGDVDLEDVIARFAACLSLARLLLVAAADRIAWVAVALTDAAALLVPEAEAWDVDLGDGDRDEVLAFAADQLALRDVFTEILANSPSDDLTESAVVLVDLQRHAASLAERWTRTEGELRRSRARRARFGRGKAR